MGYSYSIHPSIGIARVGNSQDGFYLAPETIGGLPIACDEHGEPVLANGAPVPVERFKDDRGQIKRQAARFRIFKYDDARPDDPGSEVTLGDGDVAKIEWTVHLANKKAIWYQFQELEGDLMFGPENSYKNRDVPRRNHTVVGEQRQKLIIDPGPRDLAGPNQQAAFSRDTIPAHYRFGSFPDKPSQGSSIDTLGEMMTDAQGHLLVLGGYGRAGGNQPISSFAGADTWHDDISDGPVTCRLWLKSGQVIELDAWVIVGSPKYAPELVNIVTLDDIMYDVGVRYLNLVPGMYSQGHWNPDYVANYAQDIEPIIKRPAGYRWVANLPAMVSFSAPPFDPKDPSEGNLKNRETYFSYFRRPGYGPDSQHQVLMSASGIPLMPDNSGSNSVSDTLIDKFLTLTETQYFLLGQWAAGKFSATEPPARLPGVSALDRANVGNCVGAPMCPGIEVTWSTRNPPIYSRPFHIHQRHDEGYYFEHGLSTTEDECEGGGCEPGDLTKRMAIPWQADFFQCTVQYINFTDPNVNKENGIPAPPTYYAYWWPPQSPMYVVSGVMTVEEQFLAGNPAGIQVYYARGVNSFTQMITGWSYLGFVLNQNTSESRDAYAYFVEKERNNDRFAVASVAVGDVSNVLTADDVNFIPVFYMKQEEQQEANVDTAATPQRGRGPARGPALRRVHL